MPILIITVGISIGTLAYWHIGKLNNYSYYDQKGFLSSIISSLAQKSRGSFPDQSGCYPTQAAIETGWAQSDLCLQHHNFFGITAYGKKNVWWTGTSVQLSTNSSPSGTYPDPLHSSSWTMPACSATPTPMPPTSATSLPPLPLKIGYSKYISEVNGDNREAYRRILVSISRTIEKSDSELGSYLIRYECLFIATGCNWLPSGEGEGGVSYPAIQPP